MSEKNDVMQGVERLINSLSKPPKAKPVVTDNIETFEKIKYSDSNTLKEFKIQTRNHIKEIEDEIDEDNIKKDNEFGYTNEKEAFLVLRKLNIILDNAKHFIKYRDEINSDTEKNAIIGILKDLYSGLEKL